jgi:hypothetical protein
MALEDGNFEAGLNPGLTKSELEPGDTHQVVRCMKESAKTRLGERKAAWGNWGEIGSL